MTYIRHRARMIQESVFQDLRDTLIASRWVVGTTQHPVMPIGGSSTVNVTSTGSDIFPLAGGHPITLLDYFPEAQGEQGATTAPNTLAIDNGRPGDATQVELGSNMLEQPYVFNLAFWAMSDAVADAVLSDLKDRYEGRILRGLAIALYDYVGSPAATTAAAWLEIESFRYSRDLENAAPAEVHLFFGELTITDIID